MTEIYKGKVIVIKNWCVRNKYSIFTVLLVLCFCGYNIAKNYGFVLFPDEFGYWTYAAALAGYDWSDIVSLGSYYSYGYSLILFPIFMLCKDAVVAYRVAIAVNFLLLGVCFFLVKRMIGRLFSYIKENEQIFFAAIVVFYPSWLFYARTTLAEILIVTLCIGICYLFYEYLEHNRLSTLLLLVLMLVYIHFVHMRTVAVLIAGVMTLLLYNLTKRRRMKQGILVFVVTLAVFIVGYLLKERITGNFYTTSDTVNTNDYAGQVGKFAYMLTKEGFVNFVISVAGKVLYLGVASFGLAYWGIWFACKRIFEGIQNWKEKKEITTDKWFCLFILLATIGATLINAIYTVHPGRVDSLVYGRYHEYIMPVLMILGLAEIGRCTKLVRGIVISLVSEAVMTGMVAWSLYTYGTTNIHGYMMVGMSYMHGIGEYEPIRLYWMALGLGAVLTIVVTLGIRWISRHKNMEILFIIILAVEMALAIRAGSLYLDGSARGAYRDTKIAERIEQLQETTERDIYYLHDGDYALISILQFMLRDADIHIIQENNMLEETLQSEDLLLLDYRNPLAEEIEESYENYLVNGHFILYYND